MWKRIQGNARVYIIIEPMFFIPYSMYLTYASVYMLEQGVSETQIGIITSIGMLLQIFTSLISGYLTDKMGRKRALLMFDLLSWTLATIVWAVSYNFWLFLTAAIINSFLRVPNTAWYCLLVEDTDPKDRSTVFTLLQFIGIIGGMFALLGGLLVDHFSIVPAMRMMYALACVSMTIMFFVRNFFTHETEIGKRKMAESSASSIKDTLKEHIDVFKMILSNRPMLILFGVYILFNFQMTLKNTYHSIYLVDALHIKDTFISVFPAVSSAVMFALMLFVMPKLKVSHSNRYMVAGFVISALSYIVLLIANPGNMTWIILSTVLMACGTILATPYLEAAVANSIDDDKRAKIIAVLNVLLLLFTFPTGFIGGWTYSINAKLPIVLIVLAFIANVALTFIYLWRRSATNAQTAHIA